MLLHKLCVSFTVFDHGGVPYNTLSVCFSVSRGEYSYIKDKKIDKPDTWFMFEMRTIKIF